MRTTIAVLAFTLLAAAWSPATAGKSGTAQVSCTEDDVGKSGQPLVLQSYEVSATQATEATATSTEPREGQGFAVVSVDATHRRSVPVQAPSTGGLARC